MAEHDVHVQEDLRIGDDGKHGDGILTEAVDLGMAYARKVATLTLELEQREQVSEQGCQ